MILVDRIADCRALRADLPPPVALVPTLGALHDGHLALVRRAREECRSVVVSIFVNPTQFDRESDLERYPRDLSTDVALLEPEGVALIFAPSATEMYPPGYATTVRIAGITERLEGAQRPGHFDGVATVVSKLFGIVQPDYAYFGRKDAQQVVVVRRLVADLNLAVGIVEVETVREPDGLALSSRNRFLEGVQREQATTIFRALGAALAAWDGGERDADRLRAAAGEILDAAEGVRVEYLSLADPTTLDELDGRIERGIMSTAAWVGETRLIDNVRLESE